MYLNVEGVHVQYVHTLGRDKELLSYRLQVLEPSRDPTKLPLALSPAGPLAGGTFQDHTMTTMSPQLAPLAVRPGSGSAIGPAPNHSGINQFQSPFKVVSDADLFSQTKDSPLSSSVGSQWEARTHGDVGGDGLVVSIPSYLVDHGLLVSIPFSKLSGRFGPKVRPTMYSQDSANQSSFHPPPSGPPMAPSSLPPSFPPPPHNQPYHPSPVQGGPIPLFPPKPVGAPHSSYTSTEPRRFLLPAPPPHLKLTPEDLKRMESNVPEYWEAPNVKGAPVAPPIPPEAPPIPTPGSSPHYQPNKIGSTGPYPPNASYLPPPPSVQYNVRGGVNPRQGAIGMGPRPGMASRSNTTGMEPRPGAGMAPGPNNTGMEPRLGTGMDPRPNVIGMEPRPVGDGRYHGTAGMQQRAVAGSGMDPRQMHMEQRPPQLGGMNPTMDPRHQQHSPPRDFANRPQHPPLSHMQPPIAAHPPAVPLPSHPRPSFDTYHPVPPSLPAGPPTGATTQRPSPIPGSASPTSYGQHPPSQQETSPVWGMSSPEQTSRRERGGGRGEGGLTLTPEPRRIDPRTKYAHLRIKPKSQGGSTSILKKQGSLGSGDPRRREERAVGVPKLLQDPTALDKPLDPQELFGSQGIEEGSGAGELTAPFGGFGSYFSRSGLGGDSSKGSHEFGEITLHKDKEKPGQQEERNSSEKENTLFGERDRIAESDTSEPHTTEETTSKAVPSYFADLGIGTENDLKIDSAFGSLDNKEEGSSESSNQRQHDAAKKMPSIFGFGSEQY